MVKLVALIVPLGLDSFAVAAALGVAGLPHRQRLRISVLIASFEAGMPLVGLALGAPLGHAIGGVADYIAIGLLIAFGLSPCCTTTMKTSASLSSHSCAAAPQFCSG